MNIRTLLFSTFAAVLGGSAFGATVSDVFVQPRWPWDAKVDVHFVISGADAPFDVTPAITAGGEPVTLAKGSLSGDLSSLGNGAHTLTWDPSALGQEKLENLQVSLALVPCKTYMIVNLTSGEVGFTNKVVGTGTQWDDLYKTDYLVLKLVKATTFKMGNTKSRSGAGNEYPQHDVTLTKDYYLGVYELTLAQYKKLGGGWPLKSSDPYYTANEPLRPAHCLRNTTLRSDASVKETASTTLLGKLSAKNGNVYKFDYPTEAQWENAARAGNDGERYDGKPGLFTDDEWKAEIDQAGYLNRIARNKSNSNLSTTDKSCTADEGGLARVGSYEPNAWGFYDMLGNVAEYCRDGYSYSAYTTLPSSDPCYVPTVSGNSVSMRGGAYSEGLKSCRALSRTERRAGYSNTENGVRLCVTIEPESILE